MKSVVPNPWMALAARPHLNLVRANIAEPARYYHGHQTIVVRKGLLLAEERRYLWHELVHADRGDEVCHTTAKMEHSVDREAAQRAMPLCSLEWAGERAWDWHEFVELLKVPAPFVKFRMRIAHPAEKTTLTRLARRGLGDEFD